eukprot:scaffold60695_cov43-Attheya_sp.AAC.2
MGHTKRKRRTLLSGKTTPVGKGIPYWTLRSDFAANENASRHNTTTGVARRSTALEFIDYDFEGGDSEYSSDDDSYSSADSNSKNGSDNDDLSYSSAHSSESSESDNDNNKHPLVKKIHINSPEVISSVCAEDKNVMEAKNFKAMDKSPHNSPESFLQQLELHERLHRHYQRKTLKRCMFSAYLVMTEVHT